MKKILPVLLFSCIFIAIGSIAQPTITASGINPVVGDQVNTDGGNYVNPGNAGTAQTWDLSAMTSGTPYADTYISPTSTPYASSFPNASVSMTESGTYSYYKTSSADWQNLGYVFSSGIIMAFSNPEDMLRFPFTYNDTYTDPWAATFVNNGSTFYRTGTTTVTADSYGTLITPVGTYSNVLRIHFFEDYKDSTYYSGAPYVTNYQNDEYEWYLNGTHYPLAYVYTSKTNSTIDAQEGYYMTNVLGIKRDNALVSFNLFPNPTTDNLNININLREKQNVIIKLFNSMGDDVGKPVTADALQGENNYSINVQGFPPGIYGSEILLDGKSTSTYRFTVIR